MTRTALACLYPDGALAPKADTAAREAFAGAWQDWLRTILIDHADDPALIESQPSSVAM